MVQWLAVAESPLSRSGNLSTDDGCSALKPSETLPIIVVFNRGVLFLKFNGEVVTGGAVVKCPKHKVRLQCARRNTIVQLQTEMIRFPQTGLSQFRTGRCWFGVIRYLAAVLQLQTSLNKNFHVTALHSELQSQ
jgi:hypothetical protein